MRSVDRRRVLCITPAMPDYLPPDRHSADYVVAGPCWPNESRDGKVVSVHTSAGPFDVREVIAKSGGRPFDLVMVAYTAYGTVQPRRLEWVGCPVILNVGDTHHGTYPLQCLTSYATSERFDAVITGWRQSHAHWFLSIGLGKIAWLPGQDTQHTPRQFSADRKPEAVFVGQVGPWHPRRAPAIARLRQAGLPVRVVRTPAEIAARLYASSSVCLNMALNNDINSRVFEVLSAGGCLLTDRLQPQSGIASLFTEGQHFRGYDGDDEFASQVEWLLAHPSEAVAISERGHAHYIDRYLPEFRTPQFWDHVDGRSDALVRNLDYEPRVVHARRAAPVPLDVLVERMRAYEFLQEQVRVRSGVRVLYSAGVEPLTVADSADLSRLHRAYACFPDQSPEAWEKLRALGVADQVAPIRVEAALEEDWDLIVISSDEFLEPQVINLLSRVKAGHVAIAGNGIPIPPSRRFLLTQLGWTPDPEWPSLHRREAEPHGAADSIQASATAGALPTRVVPNDGLVINVTDVVPTNAAEVRSSGLEAAADDDTSGEGPGAIARAHATVARFNWDAVSGVLPASMNALLSTGLVRSLEGARPVDGEGRAIPGFVHAATDFVEPRLEGSWRAHLWGNGADVAWWATRVGTVTVTLAEGAYDPSHVEPVPADGVRVRVEDVEAPTYADIPDPDGPIDVAVVGGEVPERCVHGLLGRMSARGLVIVENSDRAACAEAIGLLGTAGWRRIDFWGILPQFLFRGCTTVFFKDERHVAPTGMPDAHQSSLGPSFAQVTGQ